jgi:hypothetical protein
LVLDKDSETDAEHGQITYASKFMKTDRRMLGSVNGKPYPWEVKSSAFPR